VKNVDTRVTDSQGNYRFTKLLAGWYHIRAVRPGYSFEPARPKIVVADGAAVQVGDWIGRTGNAGPCLPPHLHFEVQKEISEDQRIQLGLPQPYAPVDPYGWDGSATDCRRSVGDPYPCIAAGINNLRLWFYEPIVESVSAAATTGP